MRTKQNTSAFTVIEMMIVITVLGILALLLTPALSKRPSGVKSACVNNLKHIGYAFRIWATDYNGKFPTEISATNGGAMEAVMAGNVAMAFRVMSNELNTPKILFCPAEKRRIQATSFDLTLQASGTSSGIPFVGNTNLTYFVGLDTNTNLPDMFLSGDDNILAGGGTAKPGILPVTTNTPVAWSEARHEKQGNVGLADGSVQAFSSSALRTALANTGVETNRLAMP